MAFQETESAAKTGIFKLYNNDTYYSYLTAYHYFCTQMSRITNILLFLFILGTLTISCRKEDIIDDDPDIKLRFSTDTLTFDTVFTSVGSSTQWIKVINPSTKKIRISNIRLDGGTDSRFRMNVDGESGISVNDIEIAAEDSIFIFVKVSIDPNQQNTPLIVEDGISFETNGNHQRIQLVAWGQDAYFYRRAVLQGDFIWTNDKPHVIYDWIIVDSSFSLTIEAGTRVHLHAYSVLAVNVAASLKVEGTLDDPVLFRGDRLEAQYQDVPGQWGRIWLSPGSIDNVINYAIIENGQVGVQADTLGNSTNPTLTIRNSIIRNMSVSGMLLQGTDVEASNCLISDCGEFALILNLGGTYDFRHCTIGNYYDFGVRQTPSLVLNNYYIYEYDTIARDLSSAYFGNCIIWGRNPEEILLDRTQRADFNYMFDHCLFRTEMNTSDPAIFLNCIKNQDPKFLDPYLGDFTLDAGSPAIDQGDLQIANEIPFDLNGNIRIPAPDLGAYEFQVE